MFNRLFDTGMKVLFLLGLAGGVAVLWILVVSAIIDLATGVKLY